MNITAVIQCFDKNVLGTTQRWSERIKGQSLLNIVIDKLESIPEITSIMSYADGNWDGKDISQRGKIISSRKWSLEGWRGGAFSTMWFDEYCNPYILQDAINKTDASGILVIPATAILLDIEMTRKLIKFYEEHRLISNYVFSQAPVGMTSIIYGRNIIEKMVKNDFTIKNLGIQYDRLSLDKDFILFNNNLFVDKEFRCMKARFTADTKRGFKLIKKLYALDGIKSYPKVKDWHENQLREIEIEVTQNCQLSCVMCQRKLKDHSLEMSLEAFKGHIDNLPINKYDDLLLTFSGYGEPTLHPKLPEMMKYAKEKGIFGIHLSTNGINLPESLCEAIRPFVDIVTISMFAFKAETYQAVTGGDFYKYPQQAIMNCIKNDILVIPEIIKMKENNEEIEQWYDYWYDITGWASIKTFNDGCGAFSPGEVVSLLPATRPLKCRHQREMLYIWADNTKTDCPQVLHNCEKCKNWM